MHSEILNLMLDYYNKHLPADENYIKEVSSIINKYYNLRDYVKDISDVRISKNGINVKGGSYNYAEKKIEIDVVQNQITANNLISQRNDVFEPHEEELLRLVMVTVSILHEYKHALQYRLIKEGNKDCVEAKLVAASLNGVRKISKLAIIKNALRIYNTPGYGTLIDSSNPCERMAELYSWLEINNILGEISHTIKNLMAYVGSIYITLETYPYELSLVSDKGPSYNYLEAYNKENIWRSMPFYDKNDDVLISNAMETYDVDRRLYYGLPVTDCELMIRKKIFKR